MSQIHPSTLIIDGFEYYLVKFGTDQGVGISKMFRVLSSDLSEQKLSFPTKNEYSILIEEMKNFPDGWKSFTSLIAFQIRKEDKFSFTHVKCIQWYGKGRGRRWRERDLRLTDVIANPGCIMFSKLKN